MKFQIVQFLLIMGLKCPRYSIKSQITIRRRKQLPLDIIKYSESFLKNRLILFTH
ncbi:hypothetical protein H8356DRAFT_1326220 [Neocallimastix lanati (nom. inval.)]|nr:hypothetical protein H8356DRAFT_1326220 [Neocallimastix sp. JGI-2020a]